MFLFVTCHLISHATGLFLLDVIEQIGHDIILAPWRTPIGLSLLLAAFLTHLSLGLWALYRRRHLRMPALEAWQLGLGLTIPLLLAPHVTDARLGVLLYGQEDSYFRVLYLFWVAAPLINLSRQFALLIAVWTHGCIGIHMWLRFRPWYRRRMGWFAATAIALPALAILGVVNAGWDTALRSAVMPSFAAAHTTSPTAAAAIALLTLRLQIVYVVLVAGVCALRALRNAHERRSKGVEIDYRAGPRITIPRGFSILEASRWAAIPHAAVCGGRGRCTTCRVRVWKGIGELPPPAAIEVAALKRVRAAEGVRLACQVRPTSGVSITPLITSALPMRGLRLELTEACERTVTALHVDLRDSVRLAAQLLPFDALFIVDRYIQATSSAILARGGHITSIAGDGIMSVFGVHGSTATGAQQALGAAADVWRNIDQMNVDLGRDIETPLRFGMGLHTGSAVLGMLGPPERMALQFLGEPGNIAARLQGLTREMNCTMIVSAATIAAGEWDRMGWHRAEIDVRGVDATVSVFLIARREALTQRLEQLGLDNISAI